MCMQMIITGTTSGIGGATAEILASKGHQLWLLNRNTEKSEILADQLKKKFPGAQIQSIRCDLNDLASVRTAAASLSDVGPIDVLLNNAGGLTPDRLITTDGIEMQFQMNHLGHYLLTRMLLPQLLEARGRVINVSSEAHRAAKPTGNDWQLKKQWSSFGAYAQVKMCNILFTKALHQRYHAQGLQSFALHPGVVNTGFGNGLGGFSWMWKLMRPFLISPEKGAATSVYLATANALQSGEYYKNCKVKGAAAPALRIDLAESLWKESAALCKLDA
jgi:NAD(P)-dependent dehydrogenase (short-subunit alcohol dehydrogenase family)